MPDRRLVRVEVPVLRLESGIPFYLKVTPVSPVGNDRSHCLYCHFGHGPASGIEGQVVLLRRGGLYGNAVSDAYGTHLVEELVLVAVLPHALIDELLSHIRRIVARPICANHPILRVTRLLGRSWIWLF